jgi:predicted transport protein
MADSILEIIKTFAPDLELKYNKFYIGLAKNDQPNNFVVFKPQKNGLRLEVRLPKSDDLASKLEQSGLDLMDYDSRWGRYKIKISKNEIKKHSEILLDILKEAYQITED